MEFNKTQYHQSVLLNESIEALRIKDDGVYLDCTLGGAGHSQEILKKLKTGLLIGLDKDMDAIRYSNERLKKVGKNFVLAHCDYKNLDSVLEQLEIEGIDGAIMDLGVSSYQLDQVDRGFSFQKEARLDMRMDQSQKIDAEFIVNHYAQDQLENIIYQFADERFAKKIAKKIVESRPIKTTKELADLVQDVIPKKYQGRIHPATKTFQAIRIEVNGELSSLDESVRKVISALKPGGRLAVISFHSLEDRIIKEVFKDEEMDCICPSELPICTCSKKQRIKRINRKTIAPSQEECLKNVRSRSAKLRIIEKVRREK